MKKKSIEVNDNMEDLPLDLLGNLKVFPPFKRTIYEVEFEQF